MAMRFNVTRAVTLSSAETLSDGYVLIRTGRGSYAVPKKAVRCIQTAHLNDSSTRLVDLGNLNKRRPNEKVKAAIIAVGKDKKPLVLEDPPHF